ncbi:phospholipase D-like domain-containing protein [Simiduia agarivorans]|uniref:phospholipase D-like domain-containing protein n=1 Tax=Simiduia agarivorans TaxID=447471 RepID=UPI001FCAD8D5|nr:phospholipase D-like domain-containing protein [Simiduia agarivorans]
MDMDTAPRLLLDSTSYAAWLDAEHNPALTESALWRKLIDHPRIHIYQTGTLDADLIGGNTVFGKLHAKFLFTDLFGFVGTSNFDYRSRLYNSEMGFYFDSPEVIKALQKEFDFLKSQSLRWGTPEWLEMRQKIIQAGGMKGYSTKQQRLLYKTMKGTGLIWLF